MNLSKNPVIYVTRDIERALGMEPLPASDYFIISNHSLYADDVKKRYPENVVLVGSENKSGDKKLDTHEILALPTVIEFITKSTKEKNAKLLVFKNTAKIEVLAREHGWNLLNPSAALAEKIENKITQVEWLGDLTKYLPEHQIKTAREIEAKYSTQDTTNGTKKTFTPFMIQWAHSHTGDGTILVASEAQLNEIKAKFPDREARVSTFIKGPTFTMNIIAEAAQESIVPKTFFGNISYQITGVLPFTENPWTTIGNDWSVPHTLLSEKQIETIEKMAGEIAAKMHAAGWKGLFGIDLIHDEERDEIRLIEINARQPASTTYESQLQQVSRLLGVPGMTVFETHLKALLNDMTENSEESANSSGIVLINDGSQIVQRVTSLLLKSESLPDITPLVTLGYLCIPYENTTINSDLLRIQSPRGIIESHNKFNARGKEILFVLTGVQQ